MDLFSSEKNAALSHLHSIHFQIAFSHVFFLENTAKITKSI